MYKSFYRGFSKLEAGIEWLQKAVYLLLLAALIFTIFFQVMGRYLIGLATPWAEEIARYCYVWISWIVGAYSLRYGGHIVMNLIDSVLNKAKSPAKAYFVMSKVTYAIVTVFMCVVLRYFWQYFLRMFHSSRTTPACGIPMWIIMSGVLAGMVLSVIQAVYVLLAPYEDAGREGEEAAEEC